MSDTEDTREAGELEAHSDVETQVTDNNEVMVVKKAHSASRSRSRSRSYSKSPSPRKRRRSYSMSRSRSRSRRRHHSRSRSRSRSGRYHSRSGRRDRRRKSRSRSPMSSRRRHVGCRDDPIPSRCIGVFGLSLYTQERDLKDVFNRYGSIEEVQVVYDHQTGRSRGFAFIYFHVAEDARSAKDRCNGLEIDGRRIRVDYSITERAHTPTPGIYLGKPTHRESEGYSGGSSRSHRRRSPSPYRRYRSPVRRFYSRHRRSYSRSRSRSYSPRRY